MSRVWLLACALALAGCVRDELVICGELACPAGNVCTPGGCATPEAAASCDGKADRDPCGTGGACAGGACHPIACGDGFFDLPEACEDGNNVSGDGCSADCRSNETCGNQIVDGIAGEQCDVGTRGLSGDGCSSRCTNEIALWLPAGGGAGPRFVHPAVAYRAGRVIAFGGQRNSGDASAETWEWDGTTWTRRQPVVAPSARSMVTMAYDEARDRVVLFGGRSQGQQNLADTWEWDGTVWIERTPAASPPARAEATLVYDPDRKVTVMYGGFGASSTAGLLADTWEWDGTAWTQKLSAMSPGPRAQTPMAYDRARNRVVLVNGVTSGGIGGTWEWDGMNWTNVAPQPSTFSGALVFDQASGKTVLVTMEPAHWEWTGTWTLRSAATPPTFVVRRSMAYDVVRQRIVVVGAPFGDPDVFEWDNSAWAQITPINGPSQEMDKAYDARRGVVVALDQYSGTWEWNGEGWRRAAGGAQSPPIILANLVYDSARGLVVAVGYNFVTQVSATYLWNGVLWTEVTGVQPPPRQDSALAYDWSRGVAVLFGGGAAAGGNMLGDTWELGATGWTPRTPAMAPIARRRHAMAYDPIRKRTVLFGGDQVSAMVLDDTWEWDGTSWVEQLPAVKPDSRNRHSMTYDPLRQRVAMTDHRGEWWEWDGTTWKQRLLAVPTPYDGAMAHDVTGGIILANVPVRLESRSETVPAEHCTVDDDFDGDGLRGCADPDCWPRCSPLCPPGVTCDPSWPRCGDGLCGPVETHALCPGDCP